MLAALALLTVAHVAAAQEIEAVSLDYEAPPGCPEVARFEQALLELTHKVRITPPAINRRRIEVRLRQSASDQTTGTLSLFSTTSSLAPAQRTFEAASCQEVMEAVALATALLVDPDLSGASTPGPKTEPQPIAPLDRGRESPPQRDAAPPEHSWQLALGVAASSTMGWGTATFGGSLGLEVAAPLAALEPSVALDLGYQDNFVDGGREVALQWLPTGRLTLCPHWFGRTRSSAFTASLCVAGEVGNLRSQASSALGSLGPAERPWGAAAVELKLRWSPKPISVELATSLLVPLVSQSYFALSGGEEQLLLQIDHSPAASFALRGLVDLL